LSVYLFIPFWTEPKNRKVYEPIERTVKPFGTSARINIPKKYIDKRTYVLILED